MVTVTGFAAAPLPVDVEVHVKVEEVVVLKLLASVVLNSMVDGADKLQIDITRVFCAALAKWETNKPENAITPTRIRHPNLVLRIID